MESIIIIFLTLILPLLITRPFTILLHELGHAIPAIILTKEKVAIFIGSYGDPKNSLKLKVGLLEVWFRYNLFSWRHGLCVPYSKNISINKQIIYTLTGPLSSFSLAVIACYFTFSYDLHGALKLIFIIFLLSSIFDLFTNLFPDDDPIILFDGTITYNDGKVIKQLFYYKKFAKHYSVSIEMYNNKDFAGAAILFDEMLTNGLKNENIYRLAISSNLQLKNYEKAKVLIDEPIPIFTINSDDYSNAGLTYSHLGFQDKAIEYYNKSLQLNPINKWSLMNKSFTLNLLEKYNEAISIFDQAIEVDNSIAYSFSNRGLAKIKSGNIEGGLNDINHSFQLDENNSYGFRNLGIYHLDKKQYDEALHLFKKAKEFDIATHLIDDLILTAEAYVGQNLQKANE